MSNNMMKILVPVDFSETSVLALAYAIEVSKSFNANLLILNTYEVYKGITPIVNVDEISHKSAKNSMNDLLKKIAIHAHDLPIETLTLPGSAPTNIVKISEENSIDLIIMGTTGASGLKELFLGSTTGAVIAKTKKPILVIPEKCRPEGFENIVFAVGNDKITSRAEVEPLLWFAREFACNLDVIHFGTEYENPDKIADNLGFLDELYSYCITYAYGEKEKSIEHQIQDFAHEKDADLICMIRQNKSFWQRLFNGSATEKQVFHSKIPLLILHH